MGRGFMFECAQRRREVRESIRVKVRKRWSSVAYVRKRKKNIRSCV